MMMMSLTAVVMVTAGLCVVVVMLAAAASPFVLMRFLMAMLMPAAGKTAAHGEIEDAQHDQAQAADECLLTENTRSSEKIHHAAVGDEGDEYSAPQENGQQV